MTHCTKRQVPVNTLANVSSYLEKVISEDCVVFIKAFTLCVSFGMKRCSSRSTNLVQFTKLTDNIRFKVPTLIGVKTLWYSIYTKPFRQQYIPNSVCLLIFRRYCTSKLCTNIRHNYYVSFPCAGSRTVKGLQVFVTVC